MLPGHREHQQVGLRRFGAGAGARRTAEPVRLLPQWHADAGPISLYFAGQRLLLAKTRVFVDFVVEQFIGSAGPSASRRREAHRRAAGGNLSPRLASEGSDGCVRGRPGPVRQRF